MDYNALTTRRIPFAHKAMLECIESAIDTADELREYNPAMFDTDALFDIQPETTPDMDTEHA